jgi:anti-anti-sigma regulatory factor
MNEAASRFADQQGPFGRPKPREVHAERQAPTGDPGWDRWVDRKTRVIHPRPDLTADDAISAFLGDVEQALRTDVGRIRVDLSTVRVANTKTVASLVLLLRLARAAGVTVEVRPSTQVHAWIHLCKADWLLAPTRSPR